MKTFQQLGILSACLCLLGCDRSANSSHSAADTTNNPPLADRQYTNALTPTSRDTNAPSRTYAGDTNAAVQPNNTGKNVRDRSDTTLTPSDQGGSEADQEITRRIRRAITDNDQLSTSAKNIKIITVNGQVTLRGPVNNQEELKTINSLAQTVAGANSVNDQLEVKQPTQ